MAEAVVSFVIKQLGELIVQEGKFLLGVGDQVRRAQTDLQFMKAFLKDADARQRDNETIRIFVVQTREAAYDLEDVIGTFVVKVASGRKGCIANVLRRIGCIFIEGVRLHKIGSELGIITTTISDLKRNLETYDLKETGGASSISSQDQTQQLRRTYSHVTEPNLVGVEDAVNELVGHLVKEEHRHRVVSIYGMGGSGKSTIANQVYHHKEVKAHFNCLAWVCISQQYQIRDVLERIYIKLISATKEEREEIARLKDDELPGRLSSLQNEKRCLIVLDDIWKIETWNLLKAALKCDDDSKSRIVLTTRNENVARHADKNGFHYQPPLLNETESWELFEKIAMLGRRNSGIDSQVYTKMEELGKEMVRRCRGLPLAVSVLAGLLAKKYTVEDWVRIQENVGVYISRGLGGHGEEQNYASWVLALSYDDLPYQLKPCFLYLGLFPEDYEIEVKTLTRLWIAEGFIFVTEQEKGFGLAMEDVAYNWLNELVERCVIQVGVRSSIFGRIKTCKIHDLLRDLCLLKAEEENFLQVIKCSHEIEAPPMSKIRRLAVYLDENDQKFVPSRDEKTGHLRSLLVFDPNDQDWFPKRKELISFMFSEFKFLKVLRVEGICVEGLPFKLPSEIGKMVHLRFLSLRNSNVNSFPPFLGNLIFLQTLDIRVTHHFKINNTMIIPLLTNVLVTNEIWKMKRLRHLYLPRAGDTKRGVLRLSTLGSLQTLVNASNTICDLSDLTKLGDLRKLTLILSSSPSKISEKILEAAGSVLNSIRSLCLINKIGAVQSSGEVTQILARCSQIYKLTLRGDIQELPKEFHSYSNLTKLTMWNCRLKDDQVVKLEKLPNLKILTLYGNVLFHENESVKYEERKVLVFSDESFANLQFLTFKNLKGIKEWRVGEGAMPSLCKLTIDRCHQLKVLPEGLRNLTTLKELEISSMPQILCQKLEEGGEDFHKVQHIPSLLIQNISSETYDPEFDEYISRTNKSEIREGTNSDSESQSEIIQILDSDVRHLAYGDGHVSVE